ncbi:MAG: tetratricopeptide repeat protein [Treponema sp.]|jgi:tetratricopeptide (TPR) repeat protein|nr:tetratricopeptide repeat protein [Treponema sp.]
MKRFLPPLFAIFALCQTAGAQSWISMNQGSYEIRSTVDRPSTALLAAELEQRFETYNRVFHFDPSTLQLPLKVRYFTGKTEYDNYIASRVTEGAQPAEGAVYLHYSAAEDRELVVLKGAEADTLPYQAFIQFLRAFVPNPPPWMLGGFAVYFNTLSFNAGTKTLEYQENLTLLDTVKKQENVSLKNVLLADSASGIPDAAPSAGARRDGGSSGSPQNNFRALSWGLVSFFLNNPESSYFRILTDSFMLLRPDASAEANAKVVYDRISLFARMDAFESDYRTYISSRKTFFDLVGEGQAAYGAKNYAAAAELFREALLLKPNNPAPFFYLGLIAYDESDYDTAEKWYTGALALGEDTGLVQYARGVNAAAAGRKAEAEAFLREASAASPQTYKALADDLISRLK